MNGLRTDEKRASLFENRGSEVNEHNGQRTVTVGDEDTLPEFLDKVFGKQKRDAKTDLLLVTYFLQKFGRVPQAGDQFEAPSIETALAVGAKASKELRNDAAKLLKDQGDLSRLSILRQQFKK
jgi:hypothetical protein